MASELTVGGINGTTVSTTGQVRVGANLHVVGTGNPSPSTGQGLEFAGGASPYVQSYDRTASTYLPFSISTSSQLGFHQTTNANVLIGSATAASGAKLEVTGAVTATTLSTFSAGIALGNTGTASAGTPSSPAQTLDWYEEGTWTVAMNGASSVTNTVGYYTRIGNLVQISYYSGSFTSTAVAATITGLPFDAGTYQVFTAAHNTWTPLSSSGYVNISSDTMKFTDTGATGTSTAVAAASRYLMVSGTYRI